MNDKKYRILLVEDDLALGDSICELLELNNFDVVWLKNGYDALESIQKNVPDIIISDLAMPILDGEKLLVAIRKKTKYSTIPFIIITANIDENAKIKQLENGVNDYLIKPFKSKELILKVKNLLEFKTNIVKKYSNEDPFSKVVRKPTEIDFVTSLNAILLKQIKTKINVVDLAGQMFISNSTLDKRIRKLTNKNISQYIREFKMDYAIRLMELGERNIQFLVHETGFNSFSYFCTSFKAYTGISPKTYLTKKINKRNV